MVIRQHVLIITTLTIIFNFSVWIFLIFNLIPSVKDRETHDSITVLFPWPWKQLNSSGVETKISLKQSWKAEIALHQKFLTECFETKVNLTHLQTDDWWYYTLRTYFRLISQLLGALVDLVIRRLSKLYGRL